MPPSENNQRRIAVVVNSLTGDELKAGNRDVSRIYSILTDQELGACSTGSPKPLHECKSRNELWDFIAPVIDNWHLTDQFIFYFSGHGTVRNGRYCLQIGPSSSGVLPFDSLMSDLDARGVQRAIIILDACHSGAAIQGSKNSNILSSMIINESIPKGIAIIASSRASQTSHEMPDGSASVFTDLLCRGIETGLEQECTFDGLISVDNIVSYISKKLKKDKKYSSFLQYPVFRIDKAERPIWLAKNKSGKACENKTTCDKSNIRTPEELKILYEQTVHTEHPCFGSSLDDLDWSLIETYAEKVHEDKLNIQNREIFLSKLKFFSPLADNPTLHQSAVLCFATHPERMYSQAKSNFVLGDQASNSFERYEVTGPLSVQVRELIRRTTESLRRTASIADNGERVEKYEIDLDVIRELISNAVTHRDYRSNSVVKVTVNSDYIEIQNPGTFPDLLSWIELLECSDSPVSKPVNGAISQYLANLLVFEGIGRGFRIIYNYIAKHGKDSIKFKELPGPTTSVQILRPIIRDATKQVGIQGDSHIISGTGSIHINHYPTPPPPRQLPLLEACFLHREEELVWLNERLHPGAVVAVCGPGGMGKSALAAQAVHQLEPARFPDGIVFHSFYHQPKVETALQAICAAFQIEVKAGLESAARQALSGRKALLILDGAEEADDLSALLKLRGACGVLITSRKKEDAPAELMQVRPLTEQQAEDVFRQYSGPVIDTASVQGICKLLGGWPVSLRIAGQYLSSTGENAADYLRWIEQEPFKELGSGQHQEENTALLLRRSVAQVSDDARLALSVAGCLAFAPLAREPVTTILDADERRARTALNKLVNYGLLEKQGERWQISHALIHTYARQELPLSRESLKQLAEYYIGFCETQSKIGLLGYARLDAERAHCLRLIESCLASKMWQEVKGLVGAISIYLDRQGHWTELLAALDMNLTAAQQTGDRKDEGWCLNSLGYICERREEREQALSWFEQSLSIARELGDRKQEGTLLNNIAMIYADQGKYELALEHYQQSLSIRQEVGDRVGEGATLNNIGLIYHAQGNYAQALQHYEHCLSISQEVGNKIGESKTLNNIAENYHAQANLAKAVEYHEQALAIRQELGDRAGEMESLWNIGRIHGNQGDFTKANEYMAIAVHIAETISHPYLEKLREGLSQVRDSRDRET